MTSASNSTNMMSLIDENKEDIPDGLYLKMCNLLKDQNKKEEEEKKEEDMIVNCKKCGKSVYVPFESPPNEYGYGCWKCLEMDWKRYLEKEEEDLR